jgi:hypothetical protein
MTDNKKSRSPFSKNAKADRTIIIKLNADKWNNGRTTNAKA